MKKACLPAILLISLCLADFARAFPPDNAAVLYYKHMEYFETADNVLWEEIRELPTSSKSASPEAIEFIKKHETLIRELQIASELKTCDWGLDFSQGFEMLIPGLSKMQGFRFLLLADSALHARQGNISDALQRQLTVRRMAHHITNDTLIGFLVSFGMNNSCDEALFHLLATCLMDENMLISLKNELLWEAYRPKSIRHPLMIEKEICLLEVSKMTPKRYKELMVNQGESEYTPQLLTLLEKKDPAFRERSAEYLRDYYDRVFTIMEKPYTQAYQEVGQCLKQVEEEAKKGKDEAVFAAIFCPALAKCYNHAIHWKTNYDAMLTALDVYIATVKDGKLPEELPPSTYIDHFSGKPFLYEVTQDGFTLKSRQEDLEKKTIHEFNYTLPR